jgi:hypothetical protein
MFWVGAVFADVYLDDAIALPTDDSATVLASDADWDFIGQNSRPVAEAIDRLMRLSARAGTGQWAVCTSGLVCTVPSLWCVLCGLAPCMTLRGAC